MAVVADVAAGTLVVVLVMALLLAPLVSSNSEGDALYALRKSLSDPDDVLQSWDPTLVNPCTWFHITCNQDNRVTRVDLGNSNLSGHLVPDLGRLEHLQYLELYKNNIQGTIPSEFGNLKSLISLDLYNNNISGVIPPTLGKLKSLVFLRLNDNRLTGQIPRELVKISSLKVVDISNNDLCGTIPTTGPFEHIPLNNFENNPRLEGPELQATDKAWSFGVVVAMEASTGPLLKVYYENCPGCKQDRKNEVRRGVPYREFFYIWIVTLCSALPVASLFPFLYFMTQDLHVAKREEDIGFYAGFVGSAFMIGRVLTSVFWGIVADRYGRKPVIVISIISVILFNTMFGLSTSYWMALVSRLLLGCFNGLLGPIRAYASEVCRKEYQALGLSLVSSTRGIGLIVGPAIGGFFAQPAKKYPNIFSIKSLFGRFPYFLPCFCISLIATGALVACFWLPETLHMHDKWEIEDLEDSLIRCETKKYNEEIEGTMLASKQSLMKNRPLMSAIIVYCAFALQDTAYAEIFSLWAVSNKTYGGLSFSSQEVGEVLAISGLSLLVYQLFLYPCFEKYLGPISSLRAAAIFSIPLLTSYPFMSKLSGLKLFFVVNCASLLKSAISVTITTGFNILQNNAVSQHQRGAANGISVTALSLSKAIAPATAGALFSWAQKRQQASFLSGDHMIFFVLSVSTLIGFLLTFKPFLTLPNSSDSIEAHA
ncbi:unnamed protein product [Musa acuminata var. zebrina]